MRVRNVTLIAILAVAIAVVAVFLIQSSQPLSPASAPSPSAAPSVGPFEDNGVVGPPGQEQGPSGEQPQYPAPPPTAAKPLISAPLPATAHRDGAIVDGFPAVITPAPRSEVMFSSVASESDRMQADLEAMSTSAPADVLAHYRAAFAALGLVEEAISSADGSRAVAFARGPSTITVTVWSTDTGSRYTVFSALVAGI